LSRPILQVKRAELRDPSKEPTKEEGVQSACNLWLTMKLILLNPINLLFEVGLRQQHASPFTLQVQGLEGLRKYWVHDHRCQLAPHSRRP
jgi:hypothetical protein